MLLFFSTVQDPDDELQCISIWPDAVGFDSKLEYGYVECITVKDNYLTPKCPKEASDLN